MVRSCSKSEWLLPETGLSTPIKGRYYFNDDAPFFPAPTYLASRSWLDADEKGRVTFGEQGGKSKWFDGEFPTVKPDAIVVGGIACQQTGLPVLKSTGCCFIIIVPPQTLIFQTGADGKIFAANPCAGIAYLVPLKTGFSTFAAAQSWTFSSEAFPFQIETTHHSSVLPRPNGGLIQEAPFSWWVGLSITAPVICTGPEPPCLIFGVPCACWEVPPPVIFGDGGTKQNGSADFAQGYGILGDGGTKQNGSADFAQGYGLLGDGGTKQNGSADFAQGWTVEGRGGTKEDGSPRLWFGAALTMSGGTKQNGAAGLASGAALTMSGGTKQNGAAGLASGAALTMSGGTKQNGAANMVRNRLAYFQTTNTDTTCDLASVSNFDLGFTAASGVVHLAFGTTSFVVKGSFDFSFTGLSGLYMVNVNISDIIGLGCTGRFRIQILDSSCAVLYSSAYSAEFTTTGVKTLSDNISWPGTGVRIRVVFEGKRSSGSAHYDVDQTSSSYISVVD